MQLGQEPRNAKWFSVCGSFWYPGFADYVVNNNVKNRNAAVYLLNGEQEGVNHGNLLEQAPVKAHMVHEHLMSVMNVTSIFDEYGHHENKSERINRIISGILWKTGCRIYFCLIMFMYY